jgi:hypothetical protein
MPGGQSEPPVASHSKTIVEATPQSEARFEDRLLPSGVADVRSQFSSIEFVIAIRPNGTLKFSMTSEGSEAGMN